MKIKVISMYGHSYPNQVSAVNILFDLKITVLVHYFGCKPVEHNIDQHHN
jgi:hypothetical protein